MNTGKLSDVLNRHLQEIKAGHQDLIAEQILQDLLGMDVMQDEAPNIRNKRLDLERVIRNRFRPQLRQAITEYCGGEK